MRRSPLCSAGCKRERCDMGGSHWVKIRSLRRRHRRMGSMRDGTSLVIPAKAHCCPGKFPIGSADGYEAAKRFNPAGRHSREGGNDGQEPPPACKGWGGIVRACSTFEAVARLLHPTPTLPTTRRGGSCTPRNWDLTLISYFTAEGAHDRQLMSFLLKF